MKHTSFHEATADTVNVYLTRLDLFSNIQDKAATASISNDEKNKIKPLRRD